MPAEQLEALVDGAVGLAMRDDHIAGAAVAVVQNGQLVLKRGYGFAGDGRPVDPDRTLFRLGGVSKTFTWIALMKEVEAGRMRMDSPINLYLPERAQVRDQGYKRPVTVRDLPAQTTGFEIRALGQLFERDPRYVRAMIDYLRQERPRRVRDAGASPVESDYGAALAGEAVSWVEGRPYQDVVEGHILHPLGLSRTTFREPYPARADLPAPMPADLAGDVSTGYHWTSSGLQPQTFEYASQIAPALAASSTAADMGRVLQAMLGGGQLGGVSLYGPAAAQALRTPLQATAPGLDGWDGGLKAISLSGGFTGQGEDGDTVWFHSRLVVVPALGLGVFVSANTDTGQALVRGLPDRIVARFYAPPPTPPAAGAPGLVDQKKAYAGAYLTTARAYGGLEKFADLLRGQARIRVTPDGRLLTVFDHQSLLWAPKDATQDPPHDFRQVDGAQTTAFDIEDGRAQRWFAPGSGPAFDRVGPLHQTRTLALIAALAVAASIATLVGMFTRDQREFRQTPMQARADLVQSTIALLWLIAVGLGCLWAFQSRDPGRVMYHWPGVPLMVASACALMAAALTLLTVLMAPGVWRGGRRVDSWSPWRKLRFTLSTAIFAVFTVVLAAWGALEPWS